MVNERSHRTDTKKGKLSPKISARLYKCPKCGKFYYWADGAVCPSCSEKTSDE